MLQSGHPRCSEAKARRGVTSVRPAGTWTLSKSRNLGLIMDYRLVALVTYGNAALAGRPVRFPIDRHARPGETFKFYDAVNRKAREIKWRHSTPGAKVDADFPPIATSPDEWFSMLARDGVVALRLVDLSETGEWRDVWKADGFPKAIAAVRRDGRSDLWHQSHDSWSRTFNMHGAEIDRVNGRHDIKSREAAAWAPVAIVKAIVTLQDTPLDDTWYGKVLQTALSVILLPFTLAYAAYAILRWIWRAIELMRRGLSPFAQGSRVETGWHYLYHQVRAEEMDNWRPSPWPEVTSTDLETARDAFVMPLEAALAFARQHHQGFVGNFERALSALRTAPDSLSEQKGNPDYLAPPGVLPPMARKLLDAAGHAWVFGGMMSWNDFYAPDTPDRLEVEAEYERRTTALYAAVMDAIRVGANASTPTRRPA